MWRGEEIKYDILYAKIYYLHTCAPTEISTVLEAHMNLHCLTVLPKGIDSKRQNFISVQILMFYMNENSKISNRVILFHRDFLLPKQVAAFWSSCLCGCFCRQ
jgi:hypothetical protein